MVKKISAVGAEQELSLARQRLLAWFFAFPTKEFSLNDLADALNMAKTTVRRGVTELQEEGFLNKQTLGKLWRIRCNRDHPFNITRKIPYHLQLIYESGLLDVIHQEIPEARAIILFGSYRKGDDTSASDLDIAVEVLADEPLPTLEFQLERLGYREKVRVEVHLFSRNHIDINLFANIANGIILDGFLEVRP